MEELSDQKNQEDSLAMDGPFDTGNHETVLVSINSCLTPFSSTWYSPAGKEGKMAGFVQD